MVRLPWRQCVCPSNTSSQRDRVPQQFCSWCMPRPETRAAKGDGYIHAHSSTFIRAKRCEQPKCPSTGGWMNGYAPSLMRWNVIQLGKERKF